MGVTTQYLRFFAGDSFGAISNSEGQAVLVPVNEVQDRYVASTSCEDVTLWNLKTKKKLSVCRGEKSEATRVQVLCGGLIAVGYSDGVVKIFCFEDGSLRVTLQGHKAAVTCMGIDSSGSKLLTAGKDGVIITWDIINECGLYRLRGHKGPITQVKFLSRNILVSSSKDTFVKFWDLDTQHCFYTLVGHRSEVWDFLIINNQYLITGTSAPELSVWDLSGVVRTESERSDGEVSKRIREDLHDQSEDDGDGSGVSSTAAEFRCRKVGTILRQGKGRTCGLHHEEGNAMFGCYGQDNQIEIFKILTESEVRKKHSKRLKREIKRKAEDDDLVVNSGVTVSDLFKRFGVVKCKGKIASLSSCVKGTNWLILVALRNNAIDLIDVSLDDEGEPQLRDTLRHLGHRSDVRSVCFTSDNAGILSASAEQLKLWSAESLQCIRTLDCEYALCSGFLLGDRHCVLGTKQGNLQMFDLAAGELTETIAAHEGSTWSLSFTPGKKFLITGGSDKKVKFWSVEIDGATKKFTLKLSRCLELPEAVTCVKVSPDGALLAVALSDNTIKIFFVDSLKFFLSLYGHQYPVLSLDISHDSRLLISGSSDRNVKIWGLDFGDCHKSIFAHSDSVMGVQFLPKSHQFFSIGKDRMVKYWDADNFQRIVTLEGHQAEVWALAVSPNGKHVVTAGHDKSIRIWNKTEEPLILEEQREVERELEAEKDVVTEEAVITREGEADIGLAGKRTLTTVKCAERLMEAIEVFGKEEEKELDAKVSNSKPAPPHPLLMVHKTQCRFRYMTEEIKRITAAEIDETLIVLPFDHVLSLLRLLVDLIERGWDVEFMSRTLFFLIRIHSGQLLATPAAVRTLNKAHKVLKDQMEKIVSDVALNVQALTFIKHEVEERNAESAFHSALDNLQRRKKKAQKIRDQKTVITVS
ncbi:WD repeat-containing protein 3 [Galendromus occidentalis]|uniref:WD repeat-containing protein 3 n=1 Tax=Galendromus occidentalis TaxID=34638 RepID=A0AAJ7L417_9ACAR|nr:WD repeat-containing protein 3 [Galendromus occidentalis]